VHLCTKHIVSLILFYVICLSPVFSQIHLEPPNGGDGVAGPNCSFIIKWASVDSAIAYEYVMSSNSACFAGCDGDTRQKKVNDTNDTIGTESNLLYENEWYYWITRIYYANGDTSNWSEISSFLAKTLDPASCPKIVRIGITKDEININVVWAVNSNAKQISMALYNITGHIVLNATFKNSSSDYESFKISAVQFKKGIYIARFIVDDGSNNTNNKIIQKIFIP